MQPGNPNVRPSQAAPNVRIQQSPLPSQPGGYYTGSNPQASARSPYFTTPTAGPAQLHKTLSAQSSGGGDGPHHHGMMPTSAFDVQSQQSQAYGMPAVRAQMMPAANVQQRLPITVTAPTWKAPMEKLDSLDALSLCRLGRELLTELQTRAYSVVHGVRVTLGLPQPGAIQDQRKQPKLDEMSGYLQMCVMLLDNLHKIEVRLTQIKKDAGFTPETPQSAADVYMSIIDGSNTGAPSKHLLEKRKQLSTEVDDLRSRLRQSEHELKMFEAELSFLSCATNR